MIVIQKQLLIYLKKYVFFGSLNELFYFRQTATLAQLVEHRFCKPQVVSSSLTGGSDTIIKFTIILILS